MNAAEVKSAVFASVGCLIGMLAVHEANKFVYEKYEYKVGCPPSGPLACLLFCMPTAPASQPKTVIISHAIAVLSALCAVAVHDFIPVLDVPKPVVGLVLSILAMKLAKAINPPRRPTRRRCRAPARRLERCSRGRARWEPWY